MNTTKTVLLTGASSGVGKSLAHHLYDLGYDLILLSRREPDIVKIGDRELVEFISTDLSKPDRATGIIDDIVNRYEYIPYVINNAGINTGGHLDRQKWDTIEHDLNINARMPWYVMKKVLPAMREENFGRIINITSGAPLNCYPGFGVYSATKGMLNTMTVTLARENEGHNIKINLMSPGPVRSEMAPHAKLNPAICHPTLDYLMNLPESGDTGGFYWLGYKVPLFPDLEGVQWLEGIGNEKLKRIL